MTELELTRHNAFIDPHLSIWSWEIPVYLFLGGLAAGLMIVTALLAGRGEERSRWARWLPFAAPALLSLGMLALLLDLRFKLHVYRFYLALRPTSPMSWGAWILLAIYPATLLLGLGQLTDDETRGLGRVLRLGRLVAWARDLGQRHAARVRAANLVLGLALGVYTGILLSTLGARAAWSSALLGPLFLVSGLSAGAAFAMLFPLSHAEHATLRRWDLGAMAAELALLGLYLVGLAWSGGAAGGRAAALFLGGPFTAPFFALVVALGLAVPLALELSQGWRRLRPTLLAPTLVLAGGLALRWIVVLAGQA
jgi:formate-dependent nitrite reductase membrane component NrfD